MLQSAGLWRGWNRAQFSDVGTRCALGLRLVRRYAGNRPGAFWRVSLFHRVRQRLLLGCAGVVFLAHLDEFSQDGGAGAVFKGRERRAGSGQARRQG